MSMWFTAVVGLAILVYVYIRTFFPYFYFDLTNILRTLKLSFKLAKYRRCKPFYSIVDCFLDAVRRHPTKIFIHFEGRSYSYEEMDRQSNKAARALQAEARLKEGDTVALFLPNEPAYVWIWLGLTKIGCPAALLNFNIRSKSLLHCFSCCGAKVLVVSPVATGNTIQAHMSSIAQHFCLRLNPYSVSAELLDAVEEVLPTFREQGIRVFLLSDSCSVEGITPLSDKIAEASDKPMPPELRANVRYRGTALYIYTSGTTGTLAHYTLFM
ncbi:hypothetical protein XENORESO_008768 [Xenotaenia resolanae]|uniref:Long-chain-fatty-acid--CoA ligase n=1 Tax=Xenotaenia resolanae TaxID=208358 RepID=A0ABV0X3J1_9TELE